jgi:hypothetical protein
MKHRERHRERESVDQVSGEAKLLRSYEIVVEKSPQHLLKVTWKWSAVITSVGPVSYTGLNMVSTWVSRSLSLKQYQPYTDTSQVGT